MTSLEEFEAWRERVRSAPGRFPAARPRVVRFADLSPDRQQLIGDLGWDAEAFERFQREELAKDPHADPLAQFFLPGM